MFLSELKCTQKILVVKEFQNLFNRCNDKVAWLILYFANQILIPQYTEFIKKWTDLSYFINLYICRFL